MNSRDRTPTTREHSIPTRLLPDARQPHTCGASIPTPDGIWHCGLRVIHDGPVHADPVARAVWSTDDATFQPEALIA